MYNEFLNDAGIPLQIYKDGEFLRVGYPVGWNGECYMFHSQQGCFSLPSLNEYSFAMCNPIPNPLWPYTPLY